MVVKSQDFVSHHDRSNGKILEFNEVCRSLNRSVDPKFNPSVYDSILLIMSVVSTHRLVSHEYIEACDEHVYRTTITIWKIWSKVTKECVKARRRVARQAAIHTPSNGLESSRKVVPAYLKQAEMPSASFQVSISTPLDGAKRFTSHLRDSRAEIHLWGWRSHRLSFGGSIRQRGLLWGASILGNSWIRHCHWVSKPS